MAKPKYSKNWGDVAVWGSRAHDAFVMDAERGVRFTMVRPRVSCTGGKRGKYLPDVLVRTSSPKVAKKKAAQFLDYKPSARARGSACRLTMKTSRFS